MAPEAGSVHSWNTLSRDASDCRGYVVESSVRVDIASTDGVIRRRDAERAVSAFALCSSQSSGCVLRRLWGRNPFLGLVYPPESCFRRAYATTLRGGKQKDSAWLRGGA